MFPTPKIHINGQSLTDDQSQLIRTAIAAMATEMSQDPHALGDAKEEREMVRMYLQTCRQILSMMNDQPKDLGSPLPPNQNIITPNFKKP